MNNPNEKEDRIPTTTTSLCRRRSGRSGIRIVLASFAISVAFGVIAHAQDGELPNNNTVEGFGALQSLSGGNYTGHDNTGMGVSALNRDTSGSYNTAHGSFSLVYNTTGNYTRQMGPLRCNSIRLVRTTQLPDMAHWTAIPLAAPTQQ